VKTTSKFRKQNPVVTAYIKSGGHVSSNLNRLRMKQRAPVVSTFLKKKKRVVLFKEVYPPAMRQAVTLKITVCDRDTRWLTPVFFMETANVECKKFYTIMQHSTKFSLLFLLHSFLRKHNKMCAPSRCNFKQQKVH
jgi:hypothetical protein